MFLVCRFRCCLTVFRCYHTYSTSRLNILYLFTTLIFQGDEFTNSTPASNFDINECLSKKNPACESDDDGEEDDMPELTQRNEESDDEDLDWEDASIEDAKPMARKKIKRDPEVCYLLTSDFILVFL